jgi:hypothetical protein
MLRKEKAGAEFVSPITKHTLALVGYAYVDDTDIITHIKDGGNSPAVVQQIQHDINLWEGGLAATGGQLEPTKTFWYNIDFKWNEVRGDMQEYPNYRQRYRWRTIKGRKLF